MMWFAVAPDRFYVTNDHVTKTALGRFAEDYLLWPHAICFISTAPVSESRPAHGVFPTGFSSRQMAIIFMSR